MSLAINPARIARVLLADGWHGVTKDSFDLDAYEYVEPSPDPHESGFILHGGGRAGICSTGFIFTDPETKLTIIGPLTSILAVELRRRDRPHL
jgi:hypothetical protein